MKTFGTLFIIAAIGAGIYGFILSEPGAHSYESVIGKNELQSVGAADHTKWRNLLREEKEKREREMFFWLGGAALSFLCGVIVFAASGKNAKTG